MRNCYQINAACRPARVSFCLSTGIQIILESVPRGRWLLFFLRSQRLEYLMSGHLIEVIKIIQYSLLFIELRFSLSFLCFFSLCPLYLH